MFAWTYQWPPSPMWSHVNIWGPPPPKKKCSRYLWTTLNGLRKLACPLKYKEELYLHQVLIRCNAWDVLNSVSADFTSYQQSIHQLSIFHFYQSFSQLSIHIFCNWNFIFASRAVLIVGRSGLVRWRPKVYFLRTNSSAAYDWSEGLQKKNRWSCCLESTVL